jgi:hypothetical protein
MPRWIPVAAALLATLLADVASGQPLQRLTGQVVDAASGGALASRIYLRSDDGQWFFPRSAARDGSAVEYRKQRSPESVEMHTTLSAHPFVVDLPKGNYTLSVERGKEYHPFQQEITIVDRPVELQIPLRRWANMAAADWYSGDTHVHRTLEELPNLLLAEDLNVALPLSYWVTRSHTAPARGDKNTGTNLRPEPIAVDATHVIYPLNTEYEIFTTGQRRHTLGAVFVLGHKTPLELGAPPVRPIAEHARREGALLDLDKHSWPWSLMVVPVMQVDLFELANNHVWRTRFGFPQWTIDTLPPTMRVETSSAGFTEWGWIDFGFQTYYALLNCGFRLRPSAGTASGVHPVPLGFGRVYVHLPDGFSYQAWMEGLSAGRSFVTTGPMLLLKLDGHDPGRRFADAQPGSTYRLTGAAESGVPLDRIEIILNGRVIKTLTPQNTATPASAFMTRIDEAISLPSSGWVAVRAFEKRPDHRIRFAHTAPWHIDVPGHPLRPRRHEVDYLSGRMREELQRNREVLSPEELDEYRTALRAYEALLKHAE